jgi:hypothetical protein
MTTPDEKWKAPVTATEEFDRIMALRIAAVAPLVKFPNRAQGVVVSNLFSTDIYADGPGDNAFFQRLGALLLEHKVLRSHMGPRLPHVILNPKTLDVRRVFCTDCRRWTDLLADAQEADRTLSPWEDSPEGEVQEDPPGSRA